LRHNASRTAVLIAFLCSAVLIAQVPIRYIYDELGRLSTVVDANGDAATYHYDATGNLTAITRTGATAVAVFAFSPRLGPVGTTVTITGSNFSATPSQNAVTINGTTATVLTASATQLTLTVPIGATTGTVTVVAPAGTASGPGSFSVTAGTGVPTITGLSPTVGAAGTTLTVTGTNFDTAAAQNKLRVNLTYSSPTSSTSTQVAAAIPPTGTSGRITVATPVGTATSTQDFFVPPSPYGATDVVTTDRMTIGTAKTISVGTATKIGMVLFDAAAAQRVSLRVSNVTTSQSVISIRDPYNAVLRSATAGSTGAFLEPVSAAASATYTVVVDPVLNATGSVTLQAYDVPADLSGPIVAGGSALPFTIAAPGQNGRWTFSGTSGQRVSLRTSSSTFASVNVGVVAPDGQTIAGQTLTSFLDTVVLASSGTYTVFADPQNYSTGGATLTLYDVPADAAGSISPNSTPVSLTMGTPGQDGVLTFSGTAGQRVSLSIGAGPLGGVTIKKPDGSTLATGNVNVVTSFIEPQTLPATGTYSILVNPTGSGTGSVTLTLHDVPPDVSGTITVGGSSQTLTTTVPGQNGALTFSGTAGQRVSVTRTSGPSGTLYLKRANGTTLVSTSITVLGGFIEPVTLPATETYSLTVDYSGSSTGSITLQAFDVPADVTGSVTVGGSALGVTIVAPGQNASITFSGTAAQQVTVRITGNAIGSTTVKLLRPDGTQLTVSTSGFANFNLATQTLPTTGTYTIVIDPGTWGTGNLTVNVTNP